MMMIFTTQVDLRDLWSDCILRNLYWRRHVTFLFVKFATVLCVFGKGERMTGQLVLPCYSSFC